MYRLLWVPVLFCAATAAAQEAKESVPPTKPRPPQNARIYELEVSPADEPRPAMKYRLLPSPADLQPGNAATAYYQAFSQAEVSPVHRPAFKKLRTYIDVRTRDINLDEMGEVLAQLDESAFFSSVRAATFRSTCDWETTVRDRGVRVVFPAMDDMRSMGILLAMKAKYAIARGDHNTALETGRDAFTLAYHMQKNGEIVVQNLIGIAIIGMMHDEFFLEWVHSPGSPNLYWALAEVPPYIDAQRVVAHELRLPEYTLRGLKDSSLRALTRSEAADLAYRAWNVESEIEQQRLAADAVRARLDLAAWALQAYDDGRRELLAAGFSRELLDQMPVLQVALLSRWKRYEQVRDERYKWWLAMHGPDRDLALRKDRATFNDRNEIAPFHVFGPLLGNLYRAQLRQHRYLSVLRAIEALRLYAARRRAWPEALADIEDVPVPDDPVTRQPFIYRLRGNTATLTMPNHDLHPDLDHVYELTLRQPQRAN
jgi:hypothetical protein